MNKRVIIISFFVLTSFFSASGHTIRRVNKTSGGITLVASINSGKDTVLINDFFSSLISKINRKDTQLRVLIIMDLTGIKSDPVNKSFVSIGFDTLRTFDPYFIQYYYEHRLGKFNSIYRTNNPPESNKYLTDLQEPIDIASTFDTSIGILGLKIMYNNEGEFTTEHFNRIYSYVRYGLENISQVINKQKRKNAIYEFFPVMVSYMSLDSVAINEIPIYNVGSNTRISHQKIIWIVLATILLIIIWIGFYYIKKRKLLITKRHQRL